MTKTSTLLATIALLLLPGIHGHAATFPLPPPVITKDGTVKPRVTGWSAHGAPVAPDGFQVNRFAAGLDDPRTLYVDSVGDVLVVEPEPGSTSRKWARSLIRLEPHGAAQPAGGRILLLRDTDNDGKADVTRVLLAGLNRPSGILEAGGYLFVAQDDGLWRYSYKPGDMAIGTGTKILALPSGGGHWARSLAISNNGATIYIGIGAATNAGEQGAATEQGRALIVACNLDGSGAHPLANGLRDPAALVVDAGGQLWATVAERNGLGPALVPDYLTRVNEGEFFGWPYSYFGANLDPRVSPQRPDMTARAVIPDYMLGVHGVPTGLAIYTGPMFPAEYASGVFIAEHGAVIDKQIAGDKVVFIPFHGGLPDGNPQDFLTGFDVRKGSVHGQPASIAVATDGALLVSDDTGNSIWRISVQD